MSFRQPQSESIGASGITAGTATVAGLTEAMADGKLTAAELTRFYLERIDRRNGGLGAVISVSEAAERQAAAADAARASGSESGVLSGIPVLIKDNISVEGSPATAGSPALLAA